MSGDMDFRRELGQQLRVDSIRSSDAAGSGHPTSSMSAADLLAVLIDGHLRLDFGTPDDPRNDHLIFSKGHASPLYYSVLKAVGAIEDDELLTFRKFGSRLEGHPTPLLPWVDVATGSLGQGLPIGVGVALAARLEKMPSRVWVLCGDSEMAEGSIWEAVEHAGKASLSNLTAIIDVNRLGQTGETMHGWDLSSYAQRAQAAGWTTIEIDGHDVQEIEDAYAALEADDRPTMVVARTKKGKGAKEVEDLNGKHGKPLADPAKAIEELGGERDLRVDVKKPEGPADPYKFPVPGGEMPTWEKGEEVATRKAYGEALAALGARRDDIVALDGEVGNSTYSEDFKNAFPDRFVEVYIAEQQMIAAAVGFQVRRHWTPFASTFAAFLSRAYDFVRMAAISRADIRLCGSHAGVSIGEDGPSQMALEDLASLRAVHGSTVLYPSDATSTSALVGLMADTAGISYMRTTRAATPVLYEADEEFQIGGSKTVLDGDDVTLVGAGITLHEALAAAERLAGEGVSARVIDLYSVKPIDADNLVRAAQETGAIVTVEDHWKEGGIGEAVLSALAEHGASAAVRVLAVEDLPTSGKPAELLRAAEIDAEAIYAAATDIVKTKVEIDS
ncbi:MAG TPA: transketolase [Solirubrobacterales bacterium]|nr:transketolase [Solirubrobacterales bacterium]